MLFKLIQQVQNEVSLPRFGSNDQTFLTCGRFIRVGVRPGKKSKKGNEW